MAQALHPQLYGWGCLLKLEVPCSHCAAVSALSSCNQPTTDACACMDGLTLRTGDVQESMSQYRTLVNMGADRPGSLAEQQLAERVNTMQSVRQS